MSGFRVCDHGRIRPHVLKPSEVAAILGLDESTIRRQMTAGDLEETPISGTRRGVPAWAIEARINAGREVPDCGCFADHQSPTAPVVDAVAGGPAVAVPHGTNGGGTHLRSVPGSHPGAA